MSDMEQKAQDAIEGGLHEQQMQYKSEINKIIINPHYCSKEEYQQLKNYLTNNCWDWQEIL